MAGGTMRLEQTTFWGKEEPREAWGSGKITKLATGGTAAGRLKITPVGADLFSFWGGWSHSWNHKKGRPLSQDSAGLIGQYWLRRHRMPHWSSAISSPIAIIDGLVTGSTGGKYKNRRWRPSPTAMASVWGRQRVFAGSFGKPERLVASAELTGQYSKRLVGNRLFARSNAEEVFDRSDEYQFEPVTFDLDRSTDLLVELDIRIRIFLRGSSGVHLGSDIQEGESWSEASERATRSLRIRLPEWNLEQAFEAADTVTGDVPTIEL
ncbi:hypothetical protein [Haladaptatus sp. NG-SE-30]